MYYKLLSSVKERLIREIKRHLLDHPKFVKMVPFVQGKWAFEDRPQMAVVVSNNSASPLKLSSDNFLGTVLSYSMLSKMPDKPGTSVEWIKDDLYAIDRNGGHFPTNPGVYILDISGSHIEKQGTFTITPWYYENREPLIKFVTGNENAITLAHVPLQGSLRIIQNDNIQLIESEYSVDYDTGEISILRDFSPGDYIWAEYVHLGNAMGPFSWQENTSNTTALPGVFIAFGNRVQNGDQHAIVITEGRVATSLNYGGQWNMNMSIDIITRDSIQFEELIDYLGVLLWGPSRNQLSYEGIEITEMDFSGEAEEAYDESGEDTYIIGSISLTMLSDYHMSFPLPQLVRVVRDYDDTIAEELAQMSNLDSITVKSTLKLMKSLGLFFTNDPSIPSSNRNSHQPMI